MNIRATLGNTQKQLVISSWDIEMNVFGFLSFLLSPGS